MKVSECAGCGVCGIMLVLAAMNSWCAHGLRHEVWYQMAMLVGSVGVSWVSVRAAMNL